MESKASDDLTGVHEQPESTSSHRTNSEIMEFSPVPIKVTDRQQTPNRRERVTVDSLVENHEWEKFHEMLATQNETLKKHEEFFKALSSSHNTSSTITENSEENPTDSSYDGSQSDGADGEEEQVAFWHEEQRRKALRDEIRQRFREIAILGSDQLRIVEEEIRIFCQEIGLLWPAVISCTTLGCGPPANQPVSDPRRNTSMGVSNAPSQPVPSTEGLCCPGEPWTSSRASNEVSEVETSTEEQESLGKKKCRFNST